MADIRPEPVSFVEAIEFLRRRLQISDLAWQALISGLDAPAETIARSTGQSMVDDFLAAVLDAIENGGTLADFRKRYSDITARYGWESERGPAWHSELVFRVNTGLARNAGRWEQIQRLQPVRPYIRYVTAGDHRVRPTHRLWHGVILPADHPFWKTHFPPNGFNCRCHCQSVSERDVKRYRWKLTDPNDPLLQVPPDPGWDFNVGVAGLMLKAAA